MKIKLCSKCGIEKPLSEFHKNKLKKDKYDCYCKKCKHNLGKKRKKKFPYKSHFVELQRRCLNKNCKDYKNYGGRDIRCLITEEEIKKLWFRDKAYLMKKPSIDRIDNDGDYKYDNCRFIELRENVRKAQQKAVLQYTLDGKLIKEWESISNVENFLNLKSSSIGKTCRLEQSQSYGYVWKYKND